MQTKDELMDEVRNQLSDAIDNVKKVSNPVGENVELRETTSMDTTPGTIGYLDNSGQKRFDGLLKDTELDSVEAIASAIEKATSAVIEEGEERGRVGKGEARATKAPG